MSVVVRMEMPKGCGDCRIAQFGYCGITHEPVADAYMGYPENRPKTCPILAVLPENHGRLVDADALKEWFIEQIDYYKRFDGPNCSMMVSAYEAVCQVINDAPTIVPEERSET